MKPKQLTCGNCGTLNSVAVCSRDDKAFVITQSHLTTGKRELESGPVAELPADFVAGLCDFCLAVDAGGGMQAVSAGMRQRTCPVCRTEFLSDHGYEL